MSETKMLTIEFVQQPSGEGGQAESGMTTEERVQQIDERMTEWAQKDIPVEEWKIWVREEIGNQINAATAELKAQLKKALDRAAAAEGQLAKISQREWRLAEDVMAWIGGFDCAKHQPTWRAALNRIKKRFDELATAEAQAAALDSINGQLQGLIRTAREQLNDLLVDEDLDDEKLRAASEELLPNIVDRFTAALAEEKEKRSE